MFRKYVVTVDGTKYEVEVEQNGAVKSEKTAPAAAAPVVEKAPEPAKPAANVSADGNRVTSPLPGTLVKLLVSQGAAVTKGQPLCVIEAMKMENEIPSPFSGTVAAIIAVAGKSVNAGDLLFVIA